MWTFRTMIVPAECVDLARKLAPALAGDSGVGMWSTPLSADGAKPITHYISTGSIDEAMAALLPLTTFDPIEGTPTTTPGLPAEIVKAATIAKVPVTTLDVAKLMAAMDVTEQEPFVAMRRLGLQMLQEPA